MDDDVRLTRLVRETLELAGFEVVVVNDGTGLTGQVVQAGPDLILLDVKLPGLNGFQALEVLRAGGHMVPVIMLTALDDASDKLAGFRLGADDYLVKPFAVAELVARVQAVIRRSRGADPGAPETLVRAGPMVLDARSRCVCIDGRAVALTRMEYDLLGALMRQAGRVFAPAELLARVWGPEYCEEDAILRTNIYRLRKKIEQDPSRPRLLCSRPGVGYFIADAPRVSAPA